MVLKLFRSSAGSGKTHKLTGEFLKLLFADPSKYNKILAITFTNKATEEMKTRIMNELSDLGEGRITAHHHELKEAFTRLDNAEIASRAKLILQSILYDYAHFSISTIDSFFQSVIKAFSREIGIQYGYNVELDTESVLDKAVDEMMLKLDETLMLRNWIEKYALSRLEQGASWELKTAMKTFARQMLNEDFQQHEDDIRKKLSEDKFLEDFVEKLDAVIKGFEHKLSRIGKEALQKMEQAGLSIRDFAYGETGVAAYFAKLSKVEDFSPGKRVMSAFNQPEKWYTSKTSDALKNQIERLVQESLNPLLAQALEIYNKDFKDYMTAREIKKYLFVLGILSNVSNQLNQLREEENMLLISDVNQLLKKVIGDNDTPFIYEKLGSRYQHFLIDEFQDTSGFQWDNMKPLVKNSLDSGYTNLIVGDIKQSIYRWRGGDWSMLLHGVQQEVDNEMIDIHSLNNNWRSREEIIRFNNSLFPAIVSALKQEIESEFSALEGVRENDIPTMINQLSKAYEDVVQYQAEGHEKKGGYVDVRFFADNKEEKKNWKEYALESLEPALDDLLKTYKQQDICFLVRRKEEGNLLADFLLSKNKYRLLSKEALFLQSSLSVNLIVSSLYYLQNPSDPVNRFKLFQDEYNLRHPEEEFCLQHKDSEDIDAFLADKLHPLRDMDMDLLALVEKLIAVFELNANETEWAYLQAFSDEVLNFVQNQKADVASFLDWWEEKGQTKSIQMPDHLDALEIMTIHKAKGLDFKVLMLPFLDWKFDHSSQHESILWAASSHTAFSDLEVLPVKYSKSLIESDFIMDYCEEKVAAAMDNLNLLYVAMTRAVDAMYIFSRQSNASAMKSVSEALYHAIQTQEELFECWMPEENTFRKGQLIHTESKQQPGNVFQLERYVNNTSVMGVKIKHEHVEAFEPDKKLPLKLNYGRLMHEILSKLMHKEEVENLVQDYYLQGMLTLEEKEELTKKLKHALNQEIVKEWFSGSFKVLRENPILIPDSEHKIPDRVMIRDQKAIVLDFKFGEKHDAHKQQVLNYKNILEQMEYKDVEAYLWYMDKDELVKL
jgi:ATP-dependent helicase/nuclease subunit A